MHQPPLPRGTHSWYSFLFEVKSTPGPQCGRKDYGNEKFVMQCQNQLRNSVSHYCKRQKGIGLPKTTPCTSRRRVQVQLYLILTWVLEGFGVQRHALPALPSRKRRDMHCKGSREGLRAGLDRCGRSSLHRDSVPGQSSQQRVALRFIYFVVTDVQNVTLVCTPEQKAGCV